MCIEFTIQVSKQKNALESRGPGIDPFRASGPKNGFWPHLKNGGNMARKMGKMAPNSIFEPFSGHFLHFPGHFSYFPGHFSPHFSGEAKIRVSAIFVSISGRRPDMDLYQVHGIPKNAHVFSCRDGKRKLAKILSTSCTWWAFRPRKKIFSPPPPSPRKQPPSPSPPPPLSPGRPPLLGFSIENRPPPLPGASNSPFPSPEHQKIKNIRNVHRV